MSHGGHHTTEEEEQIIRNGNLRCLMATLAVHVGTASQRAQDLVGEMAALREMLLDYLSDTLLERTFAFHGDGDDTPLARFTQVRNESLPLFAAWVKQAREGQLEPAELANATALTARLRQLLHAMRDPMIPPL